MTRRPRNATQNKQYTEEPEPPPPAKTQTAYVKNIKPSASGPSEERINAQSKKSEQPFLSLPRLPVPKVSPYDVETEVESDVQVETPDKVADSSSPKKGTISIMNHTLKKKTNPRKYKCKICSVVLDSVLFTRQTTTSCTVPPAKGHSITRCLYQDMSMNTNTRIYNAPSVTVPLHLRVK